MDQCPRSHSDVARSKVHQTDRSQPKNCPTPKQTGNYEFRYDDGYSASIGAIPSPLLMMQHSCKNDFIFRKPINPLERPRRILPPIQQPWWPQPCYRKIFLEKPRPRPRYVGLHYDLTYPMPRECDIQHF
ncbi:unnamed protein product [Lymnaea stagnalis]|uniref:Uncharacterized protein n=1 Tax=Lymnaea stagnalis TaxID=6523 RepID=A0AAV2H449_LYMST